MAETAQYASPIRSCLSSPALMSSMSKHTKRNSCCASKWYSSVKERTNLGFKLSLIISVRPTSSHDSPFFWYTTTSGSDSEKASRLTRLLKSEQKRVSQHTQRAQRSTRHNRASNAKGKNQQRQPDTS